MQVGREQEEEKGKEDRKGVETQHAGIVALQSTRHVCGVLCKHGFYAIKIVGRRELPVEEMRRPRSW